MKKFFLIVVLLVMLLAAYAAWSGSGAEGEPESTTGESIAQAFAEKYGRPAGDYRIEILKESHAFAQGSVQVQGEMGGGVWFAARQGQEWKLAFDGNGMMNCETANAFGFPGDIVPSCIDEQNGGSLVRR